MKHLSKKNQIAGYAFLLSCLLLIAACVKTEDLTKDINIHLNSNLLDNPISLQFIDANPNATVFPTKITVEIIGKDKELVYSVLGTKKFEVENNFLTLCVKPNNRPSLQKPITVNVVAHAQGYLDAIFPVTIVDSRQIRFENVAMISKTNPPQGISIKEVSFQADADGLAKSIEIETPQNNGKEENAIARIKNGTKFFDENGQQLSGLVQATLAHFDTRHKDILRSFPGGLMPTYLADEQGKQIPPSAFVTAGFIAFDMFVGNKEVKTFSQPVEVEVEVNPTQINPITKKALVVGDKIPVWSLDEKRGIWKMETEITVVEDNGKLLVKYEQEHLSWWNLDWFFPFTCNWWAYDPFDPNTGWGFPSFQPSPPSTIAITSNISPSQCYSGWGQGAYYAELYDPNGSFIHPYWDDFENGTTLTVMNNFGGFPGSPLRLRIFDKFPWIGGTVIYESGDINLCQSYNSLNITLPITQSLEIQVNVSGNCGNSVIYPTMGYYYKEPNETWYQYLTYLYNGEGCTRKLKKGQAYDFSINYGPLQREYSNIRIPQNDTTYVIYNPLTNTNDTLNLQYQTGNKLIFNVHNLQIPASMCPF